MRIVIDMQGAQTPGSRNRGIGRYTLSFTKSFIKNKGEHDVILLLNGSFSDTIASLKQEFSKILPLNNIKVWYPIEPIEHSTQNIDHLADKKQNYKISQILQARFIQNLKPDFFIISSLFEGLMDNCVYSIDHHLNIKTAVILYDLIPYIHKDIYLQQDFVSNWYFSRIEAVKKADILLSISESSRQEAIKHISFDSNKVFNISTSSDEQFKQIHISESQKAHIQSTYHLHKKFIMYTGGIDHRKNIDNLILAYAKLDKEIISAYQLAIVCSINDHEKARLHRLVELHGLQKTDVVFTNFIPEEDLIVLYNSCHLFVFPSWHEGFGLPALEAMKCHAAVIVSNVSSLPEVVENEAALFDPYLVSSMTEKINQALTDENFRRNLIEKAKIQIDKFSWDKTAIKAIKSIETIATYNKNVSTSIQMNKNQLQEIEAHPNTLKKLAYVSPIPPAQSGIADYSHDLLLVLKKYYDITIIVNQKEIDSSISDGFNRFNCFKVYNVDWFEQHHKKFDRVIYHFGNSEFHEHMFALLKSIPGIVVQHDFFISNILCFLQLKNGGHIFDLALYESHGYKALIDRQLCIYKAAEKYPSNFSILEQAIGVITHSAYAKILSKQYYPNFDTRWQVIPLLKNSDIHSDKQQSRQKLRQKLGFNHDDLIVCSFGILGQTKKNLELIKAWLNSNLAQMHNSKLIFVGFLDKDSIYGKELLNLIQKSGKASQVLITGWVSKDEFSAYLSLCDIAVQLRGMSRGETSAAVLDTMNYGVPTIINANGSMAELPKDCVYMLADNFTEDDLSAALNALYQNKNLRDSLSNSARDFILQNHSMDACAEKYYHTMEDFYSSYEMVNGVIQEIASLYNSDINIDDNQIKMISQKIAMNYPRLKPKKQIFVDVSSLPTQKLISMLNDDLQAYRLEPVYFDEINKIYRYARAFSLKILNIYDDLCSILHDNPVDLNQGDLFILDDVSLSHLKQNNPNPNPNPNLIAIHQSLIMSGVECIDIDNYNKIINNK